ncbi:MAG: autotransporter outer membrane beta-barrel domain-containing protein [Enterobacteriaceae bacterium]
MASLPPPISTQAGSIIAVRAAEWRAGYGHRRYPWPAGWRHAAPGYVSPLDFASVEYAVGTRLTHLRMDAFRESGSELALNVDRVSENNASGIANVSIAFHSQNGGGWRFTPAINIGYEHSFSGPSVRTQGQVYHYEVVQNAPR